MRKALGIGRTIICPVLVHCMGWDSTFHFKYIKKKQDHHSGCSRCRGWLGLVATHAMHQNRTDDGSAYTQRDFSHGQRKRARIKLPTYIYRYISKEKYYLNFHFCLLFSCCLIKKKTYCIISVCVCVCVCVCVYNAHTHIFDSGIWKPGWMS